MIQKLDITAGQNSTTTFSGELVPRHEPKEAQNSNRPNEKYYG